MAVRATSLNGQPLDLLELRLEVVHGDLALLDAEVVSGRCVHQAQDA